MEQMLSDAFSLSNIFLFLKMSSLSGLKGRRAGLPLKETQNLTLGFEKRRRMGVTMIFKICHLLPPKLQRRKLVFFVRLVTTVVYDWLLLCNYKWVTTDCSNGLLLRSYIGLLLFICNGLLLSVLHLIKT